VRGNPSATHVHVSRRKTERSASKLGRATFLSIIRFSSEFHRLVQSLVNSLKMKPQSLLRVSVMLLALLVRGSCFHVQAQTFVHQPPAHCSTTSRPFPPCTQVHSATARHITMLLPTQPAATNSNRALLQAGPKAAGNSTIAVLRAAITKPASLNMTAGELNRLAIHTLLVLRSAPS
jgi:hypothetical protein